MCLLIFIKYGGDSADLKDVTWATYTYLIVINDAKHAMHTTGINI